ncbi:MAG TPA: ABC transporter ATP-binding protein [Candidatus Saccharibacteria bacterium]|nr:ABC transporter ATP-binding protein [Candidatus Saccharibacteria bacterium]HRK94541.1 ABC transporter ATP-binding protein [Candidatus Saccharibacteria bacterium]
MTKQVPRRGLIRRIMRTYNQEIIREWRLSLPVALCVVIGTILIFYVPPLIIASIIASTEPVTLDNGWHYALWFGISWLIGELLWRLAFFFMARFEAKVIYRLYSETLEALFEKDLKFFNDRFAGSITKNALAYGRRFETYFDTITFGVVSQVGPAVFGFVILAWISPVLAITLFGIIVGVILLVRPLIIRRSKLVKHREELHAKLSGHVSDVVGNIAAVKAHGAEARELALHRAHARDFTKAALDSWHYHNTRIDALISPFYVIANVLALVVIMASGIDNTTKASLFIAFNYFMNISRFMWEFNGIYRRLEDALTDAALFITYKDTESAIQDDPNAIGIHVSNGTIRFSDVSFSHISDESEGLFKHFNLEIPAGQRVGLVGHSGAGKSTLVSLLLRFKEADSGSITIDDQPINQVTQQSLHETIAYVPQEPVLFHRSLHDNIAYGKASASKDDVTDAAKQAHALEFIDLLPKGMDTLVGERGVKLSGGQRQRIAIARAMLKDAPILVLDEATSALDSESEKLIQDSLGELMKGRTSIVIAHRLSTIAKLDRIIVLDDGKIVEDGTHKELLAKNGIYANLWNHQSGGFIEE